MRPSAGICSAAWPGMGAGGLRREWGWQRTTRRGQERGTAVGGARLVVESGDAAPTLDRRRRA